MRIRLQLALLMLAVVTPAALVAVPAYLGLFDAQRTAQAQRFLERVSGVRLALEVEQRRSLDMLEGHAATAPLDPAQRVMAVPHLQRLLALNPTWDVVVLIDTQEREIGRAARPDTPVDVKLDAPTLEKTVRGKASDISDLVAHPDGKRFYTFFASPVLDDGKPVGIVYAAIEHARWLDMLRTYPIARDATLTLNDSGGTVLARTLNDEQWVGKPSRPTFWVQTLGKSEGGFENVGLEGQPFYSAFSRLRTSNWVLGTGVPLATIEEALVGPAVIGFGGLLLTLAVAGLVAVVLARRITGSLETLSELAGHDDPHGEPAPTGALPIAEAEEVRRRLRDSIAGERRARTAAERAAREKDNFLAMLAHELRNPLSAIKASVAILGSPKANNDAQARAKDVLARQVRQMAEMVNSMLDAARLSAGKVTIAREPVDLAASLNRVVATFQQLKRTSHVDVQVSAVPATVLGDETRLEQVFANLLDNAAKYTPQGGTVSISCRVRRDDMAEVRFEDTGSGIDPSLLPHVFDAFAQDARTLDRSQGGLGLGLSVVKELVALHGGTVSAESRGVGLGATFVLRLPAVEGLAPAEPSELQASSSSTTLLKPLRISVIDDNRDNAETVANLLRLAGHQVVTAHDGPSGIALVHGHQSEVALIDIGLPGMDGLEVARRLKADGLRAVLIAFTGYGDEKIRQRIDEAGFDGYLQKPFDAATFQQVVLAAWAASAVIPAKAGTHSPHGSRPSPG